MRKSSKNSTRTDSAVKREICLEFDASGGYKSSSIRAQRSKKRGRGKRFDSPFTLNSKSTVINFLKKRQLVTSRTCK